MSASRCCHQPTGMPSPPAMLQSGNGPSAQFLPSRAFWWRILYSSVHLPCSSATISPSTWWKSRLSNYSNRPFATDITPKKPSNHPVHWMSMRAFARSLLFKKNWPPLQVSNLPLMRCRRCLQPYITGPSQTSINLIVQVQASY